MPGQQFEYGFDDIGNRTSSKNGGDAAGAALRTSTYTVNLLNQYTQRTVPGGIDVIGLANAGQSVSVNGSSADYRRGEYFQESVNVSNGASAVWQGVSVTTSGGGSASGNVFVAKTPELLAYDLDGNTVSDGRWDYLWDAENRLVSLVAKAALGQPLRLDFEYDTQGRRIRKRVWNNTAATGSPTLDRRYVYDGWNVLVELDGTNGLVQSYVWGLDLSGSLQGAGGVGGLVSVRPTGSPARFTVFDGNGNVMALVNASTGQFDAQYEYGPFGEVLRASGAMSKANPIRFSTKYQDDETEFLYYGYRFYDARNGRWPNRDPLGDEAFFTLYTQGKSRSERRQFRAETLKPLYVFVGNTPVNAIDAFGLKKVKTGVQKCNQGFKDNCHGFLAIDGQGYGFYPADASIGGVIWGDGQIDEDDPSKASCSDVELDDCAYDVQKFKDCVKKKVQQHQQNPPTYSVFLNNCRAWRSIVISDCVSAARKDTGSPGGLWEQYGP